MKQIVLLEDDSIQSEWLVKALRDEFTGVSIGPIITSEFEFRERIDEFKKSPPDVFILDVMVRWTKPSRELEEPPEDAKTGGYYRGGIRCAELLRVHGITTPVVLYTILEHDDIRVDMERLKESQTKDVHYVRKESDLRELNERIRDITNGV